MKIDLSEYWESLSKRAAICVTDNIAMTRYDLMLTSVLLSVVIVTEQKKGCNAP